LQKERECRRLKKEQTIEDKSVTNVTASTTNKPSGTTVSWIKKRKKNLQKNTKQNENREAGVLPSTSKASTPASTINEQKSPKRELDKNDKINSKKRKMTMVKLNQGGDKLVMQLYMMYEGEECEVDPKMRRRYLAFPVFPIEEENTQELDAEIKQFKKQKAKKCSGEIKTRAKKTTDSDSSDELYPDTDGDENNIIVVNSDSN
jgi:hypothetical protein